MKNYSISSSSSNSFVDFMNVSEIGEFLLNGGNIDRVKFDDNTSHEDLIEYLRNERDELLNNNNDNQFNYDRLQMIDIVLRNVFRQSEQSLYSNVQLSEIKKLKAKITKAKEELKEANEKYQELKEQYENDRNEAYKQLKAKLKQEKEELDNSLQIVPEKYRKHSSKLLTLRKVERKMRITHRYSEAKQIMLECEQIEKEENEDNLKRWNIEKDNIKKKLNVKHSQQLKCFNQKWDTIWNNIYPSAVEREIRFRLVIEKSENRLKEIESNKNDFEHPTTKTVIQARKNELSSITSRKGNKTNKQS